MICTSCICTNRYNLIYSNTVRLSYKITSTCKSLSGVTKPRPTQTWALVSIIELGEKENSSLQFMEPAMVTRFN